MEKQLDVTLPVKFSLLKETTRCLKEETKESELYLCQYHQGISTCLVYNCEGYGCTICINCSATLTGPNTWEHIREGVDE